MRKPIGALKLPATEQSIWLKQHLPHRIRSVLPGIRHMDPPWDIRVPRVIDVATRSLTDSVNEGRHSGMRWLIYFVGIQSDRDGRPLVTNHRGDETDVWIERFDGGALFKHTTSEAAELAAVHRGCSVATGHPTWDTNHPPIDEPQLARCMSLILSHLQNTIYKVKGLDLADVTLRMTDLP